MCGFAGFYTKKNISDEIKLENLSKMSRVISNRGPDGEGFWLDNDSGIAFSHRRLSIIDLSVHGHQPMGSHSNRYIMTYNGEVYNHKSLKAEINKALEHSNISWRGNSDTEVMLAAFDVWGVEESVKKFNGMFAFAVWDIKEKKLYLVRDRIGEKPLYYGWCGESFLFASELKSLREHDEFDRSINMEAIGSFLKYNYIPEPASIYDKIFKLKPGSILCLDMHHIHTKELPLPYPYWSINQVAIDGLQHPVSYSDKEAVDQLDYLLNQAVERQMVADVPVGAFLSGGIDSSTIVSLMQQQASTRIKTFTIGFQQSDVNEAEYAKAIAAYLKTDHTEMYVSDKEAIDVIPLLPHLYDEPFADSSQIPTYLVSKLARQQVTVALSGDAGDELFGGYNRHVMANQLETFTANIPQWAGSLLGATLHALPPALLNKLAELDSRVFSKKRIPSQLGDKIRKLSNVLSGNKEEIYETLISNFGDIKSIVNYKHFEKIGNKREDHKTTLNNLAHQMMLNDSLTYLPDDILVKVDRAAMGVSLETRVPMLDKDVIEFAWQLPLSMKIRNGKGKWILRQVLSKYIPTEMIERPKQGFSIPLDIWLRGPLVDWAESLLNEQAVNKTGILDAASVQKKWKEHLSGKRNWQHQLWSLLMLQSWLLSQNNNETY